MHLGTIHQSRVLNVKSCCHFQVAVHKVRHAILQIFTPPPPVTLCHTSRNPPPIKYVTSRNTPKDNPASICASELCRERSYKYRITAVLHCIVKNCQEINN